MSRTPGIDSSTSPTVTKMMMKVAIRLSMVSLVRCRRAARLSSTEISARSFIASISACNIASAIHPITAGMTKPATRSHTVSKAGISRAVSTSASATSAKRVGMASRRTSISSASLRVRPTTRRSRRNTTWCSSSAASVAITASASKFHGCGRIAVPSAA